MHFLYLKLEFNHLKLSKYDYEIAHLDNVYLRETNSHFQNQNFNYVGFGVGFLFIKSINFWHFLWMGRIKM